MADGEAFRTTSELTVVSPLTGTVADVVVNPGDRVEVGASLVVLESMKMEHPVRAETTAVVVSLAVEVGQAVDKGAPLVVLLPTPPDIVGVDADEKGEGRSTAQAGSSLAAGVAAGDTADVAAGDNAGDGAALAEVRARHAVGLDAARPDAVAKRHGRGQRTARENIDDLCDEGTFVEYGPLTIAAQRRRRSLEELIERTPADGLVGGIGMIDGRATVVVSYDYMVLAGTQGYQNHRKKDRLFELAERRGLPVVLFAEGGGGRPGDVDAPVVSGLDTMAFTLFARLRGRVPLVGVVSGRCFAGNAALAGCCDVIIATEGSNLGMGGPAMIEGGGLGVYTPEQIGPLDVQVANGVVDVAVADDAEAVSVAKRYLGCVDQRERAGESAGGSPAEATDWPAWRCADQTLLRQVVPAVRTRTYPTRELISTLVDTDSALELRAGWGPGMVTVLACIEGRPLGVVANDPMHLGGAIDVEAADKAARFAQLCEAARLPLLYLCDTPGFMVGPDEEARGLVRHAARLFAVGASLTVPVMTVVVRKGYGLGAQAMAGGSFKVPEFCVAWPTAEIGGMGLEGAVRLGFRAELDAVEDPVERQALFENMVGMAYEHGKAINAASHFELDDVIDPVDTRRWITTVFAAAPVDLGQPSSWRANIDTW